MFLNILQVFIRVIITFICSVVVIGLQRAGSSGSSGGGVLVDLQRSVSDSPYSDRGASGGRSKGRRRGGQGEGIHTPKTEPDARKVLIL